MPAIHSEAMAEHLREISAQVAPGAYGVLVLDHGAGWHQPGERLPAPDNIGLLPLPPYAPELNPVENVWQFLRHNFLCLRSETATTTSSPPVATPGTSSCWHQKASYHSRSPIGLKRSPDEQVGITHH